MSRQKKETKKFGPGRTGERAKDFKGSTSKLLAYMGRYKIALLLVILFAAASTAFTIIGPKILGNATQEIYTGLVSQISGGAGVDTLALGRILLFLIAIYLVSAAFSFAQGLIMALVTQRVTYRMRSELSDKLHRLPMSFFDQHQHGEVLSVVTNDIDTVSNGLNQSAYQMVTSVATILGILIMMFSIDWVMTLIALVILPISTVVVSFVVRKSQKYFTAQQAYLGHVNGQVEENFSGVQIIQAFNNQQAVLDRFEKDNQTLCDAGRKSQFLSGLMMPLMQLIGNIGYVAIAIIGGSFAAGGRITVGNIQSFIQYMRNFTQPIAQTAQVSNMLQSMAAAAERIFAFLDLPEEEQTAQHHAQKADGTPVTAQDIQGNVTFDHVRFGYHPEQVIIHDFSARIQQGQKVAIVGPTGAGKTTIVKLLMHFYDLDAGGIYVDGYNINDFDRQELRQMFGMVLQDTWLFSGTIMENLRYGRLDATDDEVIAAAKAAHAHSFIQILPGGYDMVLSEDADNVSQGQKQLLTIARAILADPKILILDEATSSVDTRTEIRIQKAMDYLTQGRTSFIIAHRLSTIKNADLILVMRDGDIVEQGTHEELLAAGGFYTTLYNSQFEDGGAA